MNHAQYNGSVVQCFYDQVFNQRRLDLIDKLFPPAHLAHSTNPVMSSREQLKQAIAATPPDRRFELLDLVADEEKVATRVRIYFQLHSDNRGPRQVSVNSMGFFRLAGGLIEESLILEDLMSAQFLASPQAPSAPAVWHETQPLPPSFGPMSYGANVAIVRRLHDELNRRNPAILDALCAPECLFYGALGGKPLGVEALKQSWALSYSAFPDYIEYVDDVVAAGSKVAVRVISRGTHRGMLVDLPPTGRSIQIRGIYIFELREGKIIGLWNLTETREMFRQLKGLT